MIELLDSVTLIGLLINCVRPYSVTVEAYTGSALHRTYLSSHFTLHFLCKTVVY